MQNSTYVNTRVHVHINTESMIDYFILYHSAITDVPIRHLWTHTVKHLNHYKRLYNINKIKKNIFYKIQNKFERLNLNLAISSF